MQVIESFYLKLETLPYTCITYKHDDPFTLFMKAISEVFLTRPSRAPENAYEVAKNGNLDARWTSLARHMADWRGTFVSLPLTSILCQNFFNLCSQTSCPYLSSQNQWASHFSVHIKHQSVHVKAASGLSIRKRTNGARALFFHPDNPFQMHSFKCHVLAWR